MSDRRAEPPADRVRDDLAAFIEHEAGSAVSITAFTALPGGTIRHAWALDVEIATGALAGRHRLIYLLDRGGKPLGSRLRREDEFRLLAAMHGAGVRVPRPYWRLGQGLILERVEGEVVGRRLLRERAYEGVRPRLLEQFGAELARIHAVPPDAVPGLPGPSAGRDAARAQLDEIERELREGGAPHPALELALRWLRPRTPATTRAVIVHGDYRLGNAVVDPERGLAAILDWELAHLGDGGEDLGWMCLRYWGAVNYPGEPALGPWERFLEGYAAVSGRRLTPELARYWQVFAHFRWGVIMLRQARRHLEGVERNIELAAIGRRRAEVEWDLLRLLEEG
ncbi:MAG: phosphotransferase family protein [Candidatus Rokubacteria bacterium]|nr:phosphotransferase family protein [Candidatus Rokubacteria bacterium]